MSTSIPLVVEPTILDFKALLQSVVPTAVAQDAKGLIEELLAAQEPVWAAASDVVSNLYYIAFFLVAQEQDQEPLLSSLIKSLASKPEVQPAVKLEQLLSLFNDSMLDSFGHLRLATLQSLSTAVKHSIPAAAQSLAAQAAKHAEQWTVEWGVSIPDIYQAVAELSKAAGLSSEAASFELKFHQASGHVQATLEDSDAKSTDPATQRIVAFCALANNKDEVTYSEVRDALKLPADNEAIESAVIEIIMSKQVQARLDQEKEVVHIQSVQPRGFSTEQWQELATKLSVWQTNVHQVLSSLHEVQARLRIDETIPEA